MEIANIHEAKTQLSRLVERALEGEEVIIARAGKPVVRLVPIRNSDTPRKGGQWKGKVRIAEDFDELPEDIARALGMETSHGLGGENRDRWGWARMKRGEPHASQYIASAAGGELGGGAR